MRIVLDTNVIVAAFAARGLCADVFEVCLENHTIIISEFILSEVEKT
jgi:predicted nucleic acid-binding protein